MATFQTQIPNGMLEVVYSPDDGGYYLQRIRLSSSESFVSERIYQSEAAALADYQYGGVRWERT